MLRRFLRVCNNYALCKCIKLSMQHNSNTITVFPSKNGTTRPSSVITWTVTVSKHFFYSSTSSPCSWRRNWNCGVVVLLLTILPLLNINYCWVLTAPVDDCCVTVTLMARTPYFLGEGGKTVRFSYLVTYYYILPLRYCLLPRMRSDRGYGRDCFRSLSLMLLGPRHRVGAIECNNRL